MEFTFFLRGIHIRAIVGNSYIKLYSPSKTQKELAIILHEDLYIDRNHYPFIGDGFMPMNSSLREQLIELVNRYRNTGSGLLSKEEMERINRLNHA